MGKREDYKSLKRKLKKLERKLNKHYREKENDHEQCSYQSRSRSRSPHMRRQRILSLSPSPEPQYMSDSHSPQRSIQSPTVQPVHSPAPQCTDDHREIPIEIENLLGLEGAPCASNAADLHESLVKRWVAILQNGLNSQTKSDLLMKYDAPNNCQLLVPPMINEEIMAALNESAIKRDKRICEQQKILGAAISASGNVLNQLIKEESVQNIQNLSDSCRLLCTLYHDLTDTRPISSASSQWTNIQVEACQQPNENTGTEPASDTFPSEVTSTPSAELPSPLNQTSTPSTQESDIDCSQIIRESFLKRGIPNSSMEIILASLSKKTSRQYEHSLSQWIIFCKNDNVDPLSSTVPTVISFLTQKFNEGLSYSSLNSMRSAISLILGSQLGSDERITRFFRGIYKLRPKTPRYEDIWDPDIVLNYLSDLFPNDSLSLSILSKKFVTLLALVTAHRVQTISLICITDISINDDYINIRIPATIKTTAPSRLQPKLVLPFFRENANICPATILLDYLNKTENIRQGCKQLILTIKKPHHAASATTISRWIKETLSDSGIDVNKYATHSTRHASTSKASEGGVNIEVIRKVAGWTANSSTFARFYKRPIIGRPNVFAEAVCTLNNANNLIIN
ncbi:hypothetical protein evm_013747 [Chilo suppressalis]|nr:hypothetical protein evm_013747 [Chilo suppressalis]